MAAQKKGSAPLPGRSAPSRPPAMLSQKRRRLSPLTAMIGVAGVAAVANAVAAVAAPDAPAPIPTRLGVQIAQSAADHDQAMASQRRALDLREQAMRAAEQRLKADLASRQAPAPQPGGRGGANGGQGGTPEGVDQPYDDLARIYQTMKPARAAPVFERLDLDVQMQVAKRMRERNTAMILSSMSPQAAVRLSMALAGKPIGPAPDATPQPAAMPAAAPAATPAAAPAAQPRGKAAAARPPVTRTAAPQPASAGGAKDAARPATPKA